MITSKQNSLIKQIRSLADKKFRDRLNQYIVEGVKLVKEALALNLPVIAVVGTESVLANLSTQGVRVESVSQEVFEYITTEVTPQGVLAIIEKPKEEKLSVKDSCILLDGVADPSNMGAVIRTAVASGYDTVYMTEDSADPFSPKAVRSSMGGIFRIKTVRANREELISLINLPIIVADMNGENLFECDCPKEFCLVIGNEGHGVSKQLRERAYKTVSIPMQNDMESLNAAVSAGLLMYTLKNRVL